MDTFSTIYQRLADALDLLVAFAQFRLPPPTDATTLYYTFSTIAQTLAGALVVLGAFVLFRLAPLDTALNEALRRLRILDEDSKGRAPIAKTWKIVRKRGAAGLFASAYGKIAAELQFGEGKGIGDRLVYDAVPPAWRLRGAITWWLWPALIFTVIDIALCFLGLAFTKRLEVRPEAPQVLTMVVLLGLISIGLYVPLIAALIRRPEP